MHTYPCIAKFVHVLKMVSDQSISLSVSCPAMHSECLIINSPSGSAMHCPMFSGSGDGDAEQDSATIRNVSVKKVNRQMV